MNAINRYKEVSGTTDKADHLWRYTPWKKVHPTGDIKIVPEIDKEVKLRLINLDGTDLVEGISLQKGNVLEEKLEDIDPVATSFIKAVSEKSRWVLRTERKFTSEAPILLEIETNSDFNSLELVLDIGEMSEFEIVTLIKGESDWTGFLRTGRIGDGSNINDITVCLQKKGVLLRLDSIALGRDANMNTGTVSSGSERTKADLRYRMAENGSNLQVLGSILSRDDMYLDYHIEIQHDAPETFSRLDWHAACGGRSRTIGTGMLKVAKGSTGTDAAQNFHNLLLSKDAEADGIPELEVSESNVVGCGHGIANGPIDENQVFYLQSRGFSKSDARSALIAAFLNSTLVKMGSTSLHEWLSKLLTSELDVMNK